MHDLTPDCAVRHPRQQVQQVDHAVCRRCSARLQGVLDKLLVVRAANGYRKSSGYLAPIPQSGHSPLMHNPVQQRIL